MGAGCCIKSTSQPPYGLRKTILSSIKWRRQWRLVGWCCIKTRHGSSDGTAEKHFVQYKVWHRQWRLVGDRAV